MIPWIMMVIFQSLEKLSSLFFKCSSENKKSFLYVYLICLCMSQWYTGWECPGLVSNVGWGTMFLKLSFPSLFLRQHSDLCARSFPNSAGVVLCKDLGSVGGVGF